jgi:signal transduction histidine kinase
MQERAALLGGACTISSAPGQGTQVRATFSLPIPPSSRRKIPR